MQRFEDKVAVITGGSSGMALATAELLGHQGAHVYDMAQV
jgi:NAD(P)-dependent dehydrogenase (short-subunit alcohol dehydrogenase family)